MTNDTNTLNGALKELGETLASNLTTQGVPSTWDEGLTTLVGKVLDIGPSPTPTVDSLTLAKTAGKQILSYADSGATPETEYCTVTATALDSNNQGVSGQSVVFKVGTTTVATETTDSNGEASYTYTSQGSGDVVLSAECSSLIQTYSIEDCTRFDSATSDKTSNYSTANLNSFTHSIDHYEAIRTQASSDTSKYYSPIYIDETLPSDFEMSIDILCSSVNDGQTMITCSSSHPTTYSNASECGVLSTGLRYGLFKRVNGTFTSYATSGILSDNSWYKFIVKVEGTSVTGKIFNSQGTEVHSSTQTISEVTGYNKWNIVCGNGANTIKWKNLKIKPL